MGNSAQTVCVNVAMFGVSILVGWITRCGLVVV
jgi:hypothetical protein